MVVYDQAWRKLAEILANEETSLLIQESSVDVAGMTLEFSTLQALRSLKLSPQDTEI